MPRALPEAWAWRPLPPFFFACCIGYFLLFAGCSPLRRVDSPDVLTSAKKDSLKRGKRLFLDYGYSLKTLGLVSE